MSRYDEITAFEASIAEKTSGIGLASMADPNAPKIALYGALGWVLTKRDEPTLTYEAYMKRHTADEITQFVFATDEEEAAAGPFPDVDAGDGAGAAEGTVLSEDGRPPE